jgi:hypothetical protein
MRDGNINLPGTLLSSAAWEHADLWRLWCWCLFMAAPRARTMHIGGLPLRVAAGQLAAPLGEIGRATGLTPEAVRRCLVIGKRHGFLDVRAAPWWLRITIVNWQDHLAPLHRALRPTQRETTQNDKEGRTWT